MSALISSWVMVFDAAALAHVDDLGVRAAQVEDRLRDKVVVEDDVGGLNQAQRLDGEQIGIAGAGADEVDLAFERSKATAVLRLSLDACA